MKITPQQRAVVSALGLSPTELRAIAATMESDHRPVTVADVARAHLATLPPHHRYAKSLQRMVEWAGGEDAHAIAPHDISTWARRAAEEARLDRRARHGGGAQEAMILAARAAFAAGVDAGLLSRNPAVGVAIPERPPSRRCALSSEQLMSVHAALTASSRDPELDDLVFQLLRETACRWIGAIRLATPDVAPVTRALRLIEKYDKQRWVPASAHLIRRLHAHTHERHPGCEAVLHRADGGHLNDKWFESFAARMQRPAWAAELGVSAHWLRHTTLTDIERSAGMRVAAGYAGHSDNAFGVTGTYTRPSPEELRRAHAAVFFSAPADADDAHVAPRLFNRFEGTPPARP